MIVLLLLKPLTGFSQSEVIVVWYQDQTRYCLTEHQALLTVGLDRQNEIHKGIILDLKAEVSALKAKSEHAEIIISILSICNTEYVYIF